MFNWPILDVAIGLVFVYTLLSLICSTVKEGISRFVSMRSRTMEQGLRMLLADPVTEGRDSVNANSSPIAGITLKDFLDHPLIKPFGKTTGTQVTAPTYLPARTFAQVVLDLVAPPDKDATALTTSAIIASIADLKGNEELKKSLLSLLRSAEGDVAKFRSHIESWFDDSMDRVSGIYKRKTSTILLVLSFVLVALTNADTLAITAALWQNPALSRALDAVAADFVKKNPASEGLKAVKVAPADTTGKTAAPLDSAGKSPVPPKQVDSGAGASAVSSEKVAIPVVNGARGTTSTGADTNGIVAQLVNAQHQLQAADAAGLPIGWYPNRSMPSGWDGWGMKILGLLLTTAAVCLGAPFWFDVLNKLVNMRGTGAVPAKSGAAKTPEQTTPTGQ